FYDVWADLFKIPYETKALDDQFHIRKEDYEPENGGVIFPNPNAPTGVLVDLDFIEDIIRANQDVIVMIDEAYIDFGGVSAKPLIEKYENLLVVQTYSKSRSLAGLRIGYAMGNPELIKALNDVKYSFNSYTMNQPAIMIGAGFWKMRNILKKLQKKSYARENGLKKKWQNSDFLLRIRSP